MKTSNLIIFIGRFQPIHLGHFEIIKEAVVHSNSILFLLGSSNKSSTFKNPFSFEERKKMISNSLEEKNIFFDNLFFEPLDDFEEDSEWLSQVENIIENYIKKNSFKEVTFIGHKKDKSSYYLDYFNKFNLIETKNFENNLSSTDVRNILFDKELTINKKKEKLLNKLTNSTVEYIFNARKDKK